MSVFLSSRPYLEDIIEDYPELGHFLASGTASLATKNPLAGMAVHAVVWHSPFTDLLDFYIEDSRGGGGPSVQSQTPLTSSSGSRQARASAQGGKTGAPARASTRGSRPRRKECPKGYYWSYKEKKCVKSKFR